jgi:hypothetical protein
MRDNALATPNLPATKMEDYPATGNPHVDSLLLRLWGNPEKAEGEVRKAALASQRMNAYERRLDDDYLRRLKTLLEGVFILGRESMPADEDMALRCSYDLLKGVVKAALQTAASGLDRFATGDVYYSMRIAQVNGSESLDAIIKRHNPSFRVIHRRVNPAGCVGKG